MKKTTSLSARSAGSSGENRQEDVRMIPGGECLCAHGAVMQGWEQGRLLGGTDI